MKIRVVKRGFVEDASEAWRLSRNHDVETPWRDVHTIDCPVTEFPQAFLYFDGFTLLDREIFASNRAHVMWARTSFVDDPLKFEWPEDVEADDAFLAECRRKMAADKEAGRHSDEWRQHLPLLSTTSFSMRVSYRDLIKYAKFFDHLSRKSESLRRHFAAVVGELISTAAGMADGKRETAMEAFDKYSLAKFLTEEPTAHVFGKSTPSRNVTVMTISVPFWVRAHFARHRPITFVDDLHRIAVDKNVVRANINAPVGMEIAATNDVWRALLSKRSCWMTQSTLSSGRDPWQQIIEAFGVTEQVLPCAAGACPFRRDAELRYTDEDPGCPCPMHMKLYGVDPAPWQAQLEQAYPSRPSFWRTVI